MIVCTNCRKEMVCSRTGMLVLFGTSHAYSGDEFQCADCGSFAISTNSNPHQISPLSIEAKRSQNRLLEMG